MVFKHFKAFVLPIAFTFSPVNGFGSCNNPKIAIGHVGGSDASQAQLSERFPEEQCCCPPTPLRHLNLGFLASKLCAAASSWSNRNILLNNGDDNNVRGHPAGRGGTSSLSPERYIQFFASPDITGVLPFKLGRRKALDGAVQWERRWTQSQGGPLGGI